MELDSIAIERSRSSFVHRRPELYPTPRDSRRLRAPPPAIPLHGRDSD